MGASADESGETQTLSKVCDLPDVISLVHRQKREKFLHVRDRRDRPGGLDGKGRCIERFERREERSIDLNAFCFDLGARRILLGTADLSASPKSVAPTRIEVSAHTRDDVRAALYDVTDEPHHGIALWKRTTPHLFVADSLQGLRDEVIVNPEHHDQRRDGIVSHSRQF